jgi:hypothetical protein
VIASGFLWGVMMTDERSVSFDNRYPPHGRKPAKEEDGVQWSRIRAPPVSTPAHDLHASGCLEALRPGDHFEIQWRKNKDFPYGTNAPHLHANCKSYAAARFYYQWLIRCPFYYRLVVWRRGAPGVVQRQRASLVSLPRGR